MKRDQKYDAELSHLQVMTQMRITRSSSEHFSSGEIRDSSLHLLVSRPGWADDHCGHRRRSGASSAD